MVKTIAAKAHTVNIQSMGKKLQQQIFMRFANPNRAMFCFQIKPYRLHHCLHCHVNNYHHHAC